MTSYTTSMFDQIKTALNKSDQGGGNRQYRNILKLEVGNVYTVRLVPNVDDPSKTFFRYFSHAWESFSTGQYMSAVSPTTWNKKDPIAEARFSLLKHGTEEEKEKAAKIIRRESWLANVYVINDPTNPDNNGKVKLLRFGKQIYKVIMEAIEGDDSDEFGARIFDLGPDGCNFKVKVERQGDFPTYVSSRFATPSKIEGMTEDKTNEVLEGIADLESVYTIKSEDELRQVLNEHFYCRDSDPVTEPSDPSPAGTSKPAKPAEPAVSSKSTPADDVDPLDDSKVKELLDGLGD